MQILMKKFINIVFLALMSCLIVGAVSGCESMDKKKKKDEGLSTSTRDFFKGERPQP